MKVLVKSSSEPNMQAYFNGAPTKPSDVLNVEAIKRAATDITGLPCKFTPYSTGRGYISTQLHIGGNLNPSPRSLHHSPPNVYNIAIHIEGFDSITVYDYDGRSHNKHSRYDPSVVKELIQMVNSHIISYKDIENMSEEEFYEKYEKGN